MGNFLFQAAAAMGYAWDHGMDFTLPSVTKDPQANPIYLQHLVNPKWDTRLPAVWLREAGHGHQVLPYQNGWRSQNIILDGYWQTEKYFKHHRERLLETMAYPWERKGCVSVHVRRGDYLLLTEKHPPISVDWIERMMALFPKKQFLFFSDDIQWCIETFAHRTDCAFQTGGTEEKDLIDMSGCMHHICSASTFSWWAAWLNRSPDKRVIMPAQWFTPKHGGIDTKDIVPPDWERHA